MNAVEIFRAPARAVCDERALVLTALGISSVIAFDGDDFLLLVDEVDEASARHQLRQYAAETRPVVVPSPERWYGKAWIGAALYALMLMFVAYALSNGWGRLDAFSIGELNAGRVQAGEWWRAWTSLTLHVDVSHLAGNLGAGVWIGYLAARTLGPGLSWLLIVTGGALANLLEGLLGPSDYLSVGASTAIFTALGLLCAHTWRTRAQWRQHWARRFGPIIAGVILLGFLGSGGENTDLVAHALGFTVGVTFGVLVALPRVSVALAHIPEWLSGLLALCSIVLAWGLALLRG
jgi:rhomboid protease GluP